MGLFSFLSTGPGEPGRVGDRRHGRRVQPLFQATWRMLGDRTNTYYPAEVKDISPTGIALYVVPAPSLKPGSIVMVQFEGVAAHFAGPWLANVQHVEPSEDVLLAGCAFSSPFSDDDCRAMLKSARPLSPRPHEPERELNYDPFVHGSRKERRQAVRRQGSVVSAQLIDPDSPKIREALVVDRSMGGLAILTTKLYQLGTELKVRPSRAPNEVSYTQLSVRHAQPKGQEWVHGCEFKKTPPTQVMLHFG